jgi:hypothetical protein
MVLAISACFVVRKYLHVSGPSHRLFNVVPRIRVVRSNSGVQFEICLGDIDFAAAAGTARIQYQASGGEEVYTGRDYIAAGLSSGLIILLHAGAIHLLIGADKSAAVVNALN